MMGSALRTALLAVAVTTSVVVASPAALAAEYQVAIAKMKFNTPSVPFHVGDVIVWVNQDSVAHSATARDHSFDIRTNPHQTVRMTVKKAGTIPFVCIYHSMMRGTLTVSN